MRWFLIVLAVLAIDRPVYAQLAPRATHQQRMQSYEKAIADLAAVPNIPRPSPAKPDKIDSISPVQPKAGKTVLADLSGITEGTYLLRVAADGSISLEPVTIVKVGPSPPTPNPQPTLPPRAVAIKTAVESLGPIPNRNDTAHKLATLYRECAKKVPDTVKDQATLKQLVSGATTMLLGETEAPKWKPVRDKLLEQWDQLQQDGKPVGDYATLLGEAADGLDASAGVQAGISPEMLQLIMQIIEIVLKLLNK